MASIPAGLQLRLPTSGAAGSVVHPSVVRDNGQVVQMLQIGGDLFKISVVGANGEDEAVNMVQNKNTSNRKRTIQQANSDRPAGRQPRVAVKMEKGDSDDEDDDDGDLDSSNSSAARYEGQEENERLVAFASAASSDGTTIVQGPDGQFFIPVSVGPNDSNFSYVAGQSLQRGTEVIQKRELRMLKNREAAKECRRKKKDYVRCLENRVTLLENQNKTLIAELKSLKELYCQK